MLKKILIALLTLGMVFVVACKPQSEKPNVDPDIIQGDENGDEQPQPADPTNPHNAENLKEFIEQRYAAAKEAYFWFTVNSMPPADDNVDINNIKEIDGLYYYKTGAENINSLDDLEKYLKTLFSDEIADVLMKANGNHYIDIDGELWATDAQRGTNIYVGDVIFSITEKTDDKIVYTANVEIINPESKEVEGVDVHDYVYEKTDDGWKWTQFSIYE